MDRPARPPPAPPAAGSAAAADGSLAAPGSPGAGAGQASRNPVSPAGGARNTAPHEGRFKGGDARAPAQSPLALLFGRGSDPKPKGSITQALPQSTPVPALADTPVGLRDGLSRDLPHGFDPSCLSASSAAPPQNAGHGAELAQFGCGQGTQADMSAARVLDGAAGPPSGEQGAPEGSLFTPLIMQRLGTALPRYADPTPEPLLGAPPGGPIVKGQGSIATGGPLAQEGGAAGAAQPKPGLFTPMVAAALGEVRAHAPKQAPAGHVVLSSAPGRAGPCPDQARTPIDAACYAASMAGNKAGEPDQARVPGQTSLPFSPDMDALLAGLPTPQGFAHAWEALPEPAQVLVLDAGGGQQGAPRGAEPAAAAAEPPESLRSRFGVDAPQATPEMRAIRVLARPPPEDEAPARPAAISAAGSGWGARGPAAVEGEPDLARTAAPSPGPGPLRASPGPGPLRASPGPGPLRASMQARDRRLPAAHCLA